MSILTFLYNLVLGPLVLLFDIIFTVFHHITLNKGLSILFLSLSVNLLILPLYRRADSLQEEERVRTEKLSRGIKHIKKVFKGDERFMMLQTYYRQNDYKPYYALSGSISLLLEIPFFISAYHFLSDVDLLKGASFGPLADLGQPDGLLAIVGHHINLLPILMTAVNIISGIIYTKGMPLKSKVQLYGMALIFLVFLYSSPSGLVFYWTLNNVFSLVKNIFYKLKNPRFVLCLICAGLSCVGLPYVLFVSPMRTMKIQLFTVCSLLLLLLPIAVYYLRKPLIRRLNGVSITVSDATGTDNVIFVACCLFMTVLTGLLIPSAIISSSPAEFVNVSDFHSPIRYTGYSLALAAGTFLIWMNVFYRLSTLRVRRVLSFCSVALSGSAAVNYMFFGKNYGQLSSLLQYDSILFSAQSDYLPNTLVLAALTGGLYLLWKKRPVIVKSVSFALCAATAIISCANLFSIQRESDKMVGLLSEIKSNQGVNLTLDKNGKNVVVIMMDRAISEFFPYIIEEKPELKEQFAGFTYYPNTISYGNCTLVGAPGLFGGYEYTPEEMNARSDKTVPEKHNEALKVMPVLFSQNGYTTTVCDPPFAGFNWLPNLSIYDDYPEIRRYNTKSLFTDNSNSEMKEDPLNRNFFAYSMMRSSPVLLHLPLYNKGAYNHYSKITYQTIDSIYTAHGSFYNVDSYFIGSYNTLKQLPSVTKPDDSGKGAFLMMSNDTAHDVVMLSEPEYEPSLSIDNTKYESEHKIRLAADGSELEITTTSQMVHYQCNMASYIQLGKWMDYLRENNLYDNTRIIIVSDHGKNLNNLFGGQITAGKEKAGAGEDASMLYKALLLVKDFGGTELTTDPTFMTNADTPSIALEGLIEDPVNPFTGNKITNEAKNRPEHHIANSRLNMSSDYSGKEKQYKQITWISFSGEDTSDLGSWRIIGNQLD